MGATNKLLSSFQRNRDSVSVGAYAKGSDPMPIKPLPWRPQLEAFLQQGIFERADGDLLQAPDLPFPKSIVPGGRRRHNMAL